ncbi:MAG: hypothetical protein ACYC6N_32090 [Pirellulaceae bacterium]
MLELDLDLQKDLGIDTVNATCIEEKVRRSCVGRRARMQTGKMKTNDPAQTIETEDASRVVVAW